MSNDGDTPSLGLYNPKPGEIPNIVTYRGHFTPIFASELTTRNLTQLERHGLLHGTHKLVTSGALCCGRNATPEEIAHAYDLKEKAEKEEKNKATRAVARIQQAAAGVPLPTQCETQTKAQWRAARSPEQVELDRQRDAERKRKRRAELKAPQP
jgi:hypothetical protein